MLACDNKTAKITLVVDGQAKGRLPFVELRNPTDKQIVATLHSPVHAPLFGGMSTPVTLPLGDSRRLTIDGKAFKYARVPFDIPGAKWRSDSCNRCSTRT